MSSNLSPISVFMYCSICGSKTATTPPNLLVCTNCGFNNYLNPKACNAVILENEMGEILFVERALEPQKGMLDLPGGFIDLQETAEASVARELREELGITVDNCKYFGSYTDTYIYSGVEFDTLGFVYTARVTDIKPQALDDAAQIVWVRKDKIDYSKIAFKSVVAAVRDYISISA